MEGTYVSMITVDVDCCILADRKNVLVCSEQAVAGQKEATRVASYKKPQEQKLLCTIMETFF